jgi:ParB family chromosome partitioning protein
MSTQTQHVQFRFIAARALSLSSLNVRKTGGEVGIEQLAALIHAEGVLQNLDVYECPQGEGKKGTTHAVVAGGRRWRALQLLIRQKRIKPDFAVPCLIISYERAVQISLAENSGREPMHPADEFEAFRLLIDAGQSVEDVAARFGVKPVVVQRRLKLANVNPMFITLYREGKITLEHLMAFAVTDDHARQQQAWDSLKPYDRHPSTLRQVLTEHEVSLKDSIGRFVGLKAYEKAGGFVRRDLFAREDEGAMLDGELVRKLAVEKLEKHAAQVQAEGLPWVEVRPDWDYASRAEYGRVRTIVREPTEAERQAMEEVNGRKAQVEAQMAQAGDDEDRLAELSDLENEIEEQMDALIQQRRVADPAQQACAGAVVSIGHDGKVVIERNLLKPEDATRFARQEKAQKRAAAQNGPRVHSAALVRRLTAQRTLALQATVAERPDVALVALTHRLLLQGFYGSRFDSALKVDTGETGLVTHATELAGCKAHAALQARREAMEARLPSDPGRLFAWLLEQPQADVLSLLAFCVAQTVDGVQSNEGPSVADELAHAAGLDMRAWWTPTAETYLGSVPKARILEVVKEAVSAQAATPLEKLKKSALVKLAETQLAGTGWLPSLLRNVA